MFFDLGKSLIFFGDIIKVDTSVDHDRVKEIWGELTGN